MAWLQVSSVKYICIYFHRYLHCTLNHSSWVSIITNDYDLLTTWCYIKTSIFILYAFICFSRDYFVEKAHLIKAVIYFNMPIDFNENGKSYEILAQSLANNTIYHSSFRLLLLHFFSASHIRNLSSFSSPCWPKYQIIIPDAQRDTSLSHTTLPWRYNENDGASNHHHRHCLLIRLFRCRSKKAPQLRVTGLCWGNSPVTGEFCTQKTSNAENVSVWWPHHEPSIHHHHQQQEYLYRSLYCAISQTTIPYTII